MFDVKTLNEITHGNQSQTNDLLNTFYLELEKKIPLLQNFVKQNDLPSLKEEMHRLKSNIILIDEELGDKFLALERALKEKDNLDNSFISKLNHIFDDLEMLNHEIKEYLSER